MVAALLAAATPHWGRKVSVWTAALLLAGLVGVSRLYLGASWLTDVLGGLTLGAAWLFALLTATRAMSALHRDSATPPRHDSRPRRAGPPRQPAAAPGKAAARARRGPRDG
jgi:membrane-associated phospholipid phosphatase